LRQPADYFANPLHGVPDLSSFERIVVVGISGCGKSTVARALAGGHDLAHIELDSLYWGPNWQPKPEAEFKSLVESAVMSPQWVVDGNYSVVRELVWPRAQAIVWLNLSLPAALWQVFRRTVARVVLRQRLWHGNRESVARSLSKHSILRWVWSMHGRRQAEFSRIRAANTYTNLVWFELRSPSEVRRLVRSLANAG
jgi:adenylate kinase family enzyme